MNSAMIPQANPKDMSRNGSKEKKGIGCLSRGGIGPDITSVP